MQGGGLLQLVSFRSGGIAPLSGVWSGDGADVARGTIRQDGYCRRGTGGGGQRELDIFD